jgi:hypothetical protein
VSINSNRKQNYPTQNLYSKRGYLKYCDRDAP